VLNLSGMVSPGQAVRVGQLTGAKILITGSVVEDEAPGYLGRIGKTPVAVTKTGVWRIDFDLAAVKQRYEQDKKGVGQKQPAISAMVRAGKRFAPRYTHAKVVGQETVDDGVYMLVVEPTVIYESMLSEPVASDMKTYSLYHVDSSGRAMRVAYAHTAAEVRGGFRLAEREVHLPTAEGVYAFPLSGGRAARIVDTKEGAPAPVTPARIGAGDHLSDSYFEPADSVSGS